MDDRSGVIDTFLHGAGWSGAERTALAGDASARRYERLYHPQEGRAVLMDAPPGPDEDIGPFIDIARHLAALDLSVPDILAADPEHGLLLLEDLGDALFARVIPQAPELEETLYRAAVDALLHLHDTPPPARFPDYRTEMSDLAALAYDWYLAGISGDRAEDRKAQFRDCFAARLGACDTGAPVLILRDYHAENLIWLPDRKGVRRVGLLDFQDARAGPRAYDLVSLLQDARRDVPDTIESSMIRYYLDRCGVAEDAFRETYALMGLQRNLRILGVFARLSLLHGKPRYIDLIPRVWSFVERALDAPGFGDLKARVLGDLPPPTPARLKVLKEKCATVPHRS